MAHAEALIAHFKRARARTLAYAETTQDDLRSHFHPQFALGQFDVYQWLLFIAGQIAWDAEQRIVTARRSRHGTGTWYGGSAPDG